MQLTFFIETSDAQTVQAFTEVAKALKVPFRIEPGSPGVSPSERRRRVSVARKFKGSLLKYATGHSPNKHDWYLQ